MSSYPVHRSLAPTRRCSSDETIIPHIVEYKPLRHAPSPYRVFCGAPRVRFPFGEGETDHLGSWGAPTSLRTLRCLAPSAPLDQLVHHGHPHGPGAEYDVKLAVGGHP
jgi:hypothetical protein